MTNPEFFFSTPSPIDSFHCPFSERGGAPDRQKHLPAPPPYRNGARCRTLSQESFSLFRALPPFCGMGFSSSGTDLSPLFDSCFFHCYKFPRRPNGFPGFMNYLSPFSFSVVPPMGTARFSRFDMPSFVRENRSPFS